MKAGFWHSVGIVQVNVPEPVKAKTALLCVEMGNGTYGDIIRKVEIGVEVLYRAASVEDRHHVVHPFAEHIQVIPVSLLRVADHVTTENHVKRLVVLLDKLRVLAYVCFLALVESRKSAVVQGENCGWGVQEQSHCFGSNQTTYLKTPHRLCLAGS